MIWLSWRQFRAQALVAAVALILLLGYLVMLGRQIRDGDYSGAELREHFQGRVYLLDAVPLLTPALIGLFWGAPLVARELETGTHRLAWNQSVTRRRWLAVKLLLVGFAALVAGALVSASLTWAASPLDQFTGDRFSTIFFGTRNLAPAAYGIFALVLGVVVGLLIRRTVPAMALTLLVLVVTQTLTPNLVRPHLLPAEHMSAPVTAEVVRNLSFLGQQPEISGLKVPGAWVISTSELRTADGLRVGADAYGKCVAGSFDKAADCLGALNLHVDVDYQPTGRYWTFQWLESGLYLGLALLLAALGLWRIRRAAH
ncbi:ABC transporter permease subunit [Actinoplanes sp. L3-i22]|uniref:ABC transporter permease subunit n=1 Tax=Actinoplanes sp. L3-i22 TaxID=2836373 RepID=UPI001C792B19|nr:ABC transporter permease subunit [Actinoplanes sp. L3-i22]BCY13961.1 transporter [Actinoplanes sp. L3-i22]